MTRRSRARKRGALIIAKSRSGAAAHRPLLTGIAGLGGARLLQTGVAAVGSIAISRLLGPSDRGIYSAAIVIASLCFLIFSAGSPAALSWALARHTRSTRHVLRQGGIVVMAVLVGTTVVTALLKAFSGSDTYSRIPVLATTAFAGVTAWGGMVSAVLIGTRRYSAHSRVIAAVAVLGVPVSVFLALLSKDPRLTIFGSVFGGTAVYLLATKRLLASARTSESGDCDSSRPSLGRFALLSWLGNMIQNVNFRLDIVLLGFWRSSAEVGTYAAAVGIAQLLWMLPSAAGEVLFAESATDSVQASASAALRNLERRMFAILAVSCIPAAALAVLSRPIVTALLGQDYAESVVALRWLLPGVAGFALVQVGGNGLAGVGRPALNTAIAGVSAVVTVTGNVLLIPRWGVPAAAAVSSASYLLSGTLTLGLVHKLARREAAGT